MAEEVLRLEKVCKVYNQGEPSETEVLHDVETTIFLFADKMFVKVDIEPVGKIVG